MNDNDKFDAIRLIRNNNESRNGQSEDNSKKSNKMPNLLEKIKYVILGIFFDKNKKIKPIVLIILLGFGLWLKVSSNEFAHSGYVYGYINKNGETIIKPQFGNAGDFHEGLAYACKYGKCGYINKTGDFIIKRKFLATRDFHEGLAAVKKGSFCGYIDKSGKFIIKPKFIWAGDFHEGLAQVTFWDGVKRKDDYTNGIKDDYDSGRNPVKTLSNLVNIKDGYIDKTGKIVMIFPPCSVTSSDFYDGLAYIQINDRYGFIDKKGNMAIPPKFNDIYGHGGLPMPVSVGDQWGIIDKTGNYILEPEYNDRIYGFSEGLAIIKFNNKWCYINKTGKLVMKTDFDDIGPFDEGLAPFILNSKQGYINKEGKIVISPIFNLHKSPNYPGFKEGLAAVNINNKVGFINKLGQVVIKPAFDTVTYFSDGLVKVGMGK